MHSLQLKAAPAVTLPSPAKRIVFLHPAYEPHEQPCLFALPAVDQSQHNPEQWGICHETALAACRIVAANQAGRLTTDRAGANPVETPLHTILTANCYYYAIDGTPTTTRYPIVPSFRDWVFPTDGPPAEWTVEPNDFEGLSGLCQLTNQRFPENAHLVPRFESALLARSTLNMLPDTLNDGSNIVQLRGDIHSVFDQKMFALVPKRSDPAHRHTFVAHVLDSDASGYINTLHNYAMQRLDRFAGPFLYARFAWAILFRTRGFLCAGPDRAVAIRSVTGGNEIKTMTCAALRQAYGGSGSRTGTPLHRTWSRRNSSSDLCDKEAGDDDDDGNYVQPYIPNQTFAADAFTDDFAETSED